MGVDYGEVHTGMGGVPTCNAEVEVSSDRISSPESSRLLKHESTSIPHRNLYPVSRTADIDSARHANESLHNPAASLKETGGHDIPNIPSPQPIQKIRQPAPDTIRQRQLIAELDAMFPDAQRAALIALHRALVLQSPGTWHVPQHASAGSALEQLDWQDTTPAWTWWHGMTYAPRIVWYLVWYLLISMLACVATSLYLLFSIIPLLCKGTYALSVDSLDYLERCR